MRTALVALLDEVWAIIYRDLGDTRGRGCSDTVRTIVVAWLSDERYLAKGAKNAKKRQERRD